ncbi:MAG: putative negative regulator of RcsB-dependent stress response, partial [Bacteroidia bacterium]
MKQTDFSFTIKGKSFIPNRNFWLILLVLFTIGAWTGYDLYKHYEANQLQLNELNEKWEGFGNELTEVEDLQSKNSNKVSQFAPKLIVAIISLLGIFLRKIIDWSLKLNNTLLLTQ